MRIYDKLIATISARQGAVILLFPSGIGGLFRP